MHSRPSQHYHKVYNSNVDEKDSMGIAFNKFWSQGTLSRCPSTNLMHVKFEAPTNMSSCSRQQDLIKDISQRLLSHPTFKQRNFRENYCAAPWWQNVDLLKLS